METRITILTILFQPFIFDVAIKTLVKSFWFKWKLRINRVRPAIGLPTLVHHGPIDVQQLVHIAVPLPGLLDPLGQLSDCEVNDGDQWYRSSYCHPNLPFKRLNENSHLKKIIYQKLTLKMGRSYKIKGTSGPSDFSVRYSYMSTMWCLLSFLVWLLQ